MPKVRDLSKSAKRLESTAAARGEEYEEGVSTNTDWAARAIAAQKNYDDGVNEAVAKKRFSKGVQRVGQGAFTASASKKGRRNYTANVAEAGADWEKGFAPFKGVIESVQLRPRGRRGDPANYERVKQIGDALSRKRQEMQGG